MNTANVNADRELERLRSSLSGALHDLDDALGALDSLSDPISGCSATVLDLLRRIEHVEDEWETVWRSPLALAQDLARKAREAIEREAGLG